MLSPGDLMATLLDRLTTGRDTPEGVSATLKLVIDKLDEGSRSDAKRCKGRSLEEAFQLLRRIPEAELRSLEERHLVLLVRLLISMQSQMFNVSVACRKLDQMLQHLAKVDHQLLFRETCQCLQSIVHTDQMLTTEDLLRACMFLEESVICRDVWRETFPVFLNKMSQLFPAVLQQEALRNGPLCYAAVKVCLQMFQRLSRDVAPLVWGKEYGSPVMQNILQSLMDLILGKSSNRDTRLLAGTAVVMLINTATETEDGAAAALSLLKVSNSEPWQLNAGALQVQCVPTGRDGVDRLAVSRGLLMCCRQEILLSPTLQSPKTCLLVGGVFPLVTELCEEKLDCHYYVFEVLTLWLKKFKESLADLWEMTGARLLPDACSLQQQLIQVIWNNAESPVEGVSEFVRSAFRLLLDLYEMECERFGDTKKTLYVALLQRVTKLPWEAKAKYPPLCALVLYLGTDMVLDQYVELPSHLLKCLSTNQLSPCASELYKCLIQQQRRELCAGSPKAPPPELELAEQWARHWLPFLLEALSSEVTLLQSNGSSHLLPATLQVFPSAVEPLLASLDPAAPGHLHAWACIMSGHRSMTGCSPWAMQEGSAPETLQMALGSFDEKVRIAAFNLLCLSPKTKDAPTHKELSIMKTFIPLNLNSESSPFRQHFQAGVKRFLVRIRDSCLAHISVQKGKKRDPSTTEEAEIILHQGIEYIDWLSQLPYGYLAPGHSYQRKKTVLLLLSAVLETCTDTWRPDRKKGQPPANMSSLINSAKKRGKWDFFCRAKQLALVGCLEDSTNEIRELSAGLLLRFFPPSFPDDISFVLFGQSKQLLCSPRVHEAQMGALMTKVLLHKCQGQLQDSWMNSSGDPRTSGMVRYLVKELDHHHLTAKADMMLAARTKPVHGVLSALERCLLEVPGSLCDVVDHSLIVELLSLLENIALLLLRVLYGAQDTSADEEGVPPSFCDMGNAINSLIAQAAGERHGEGDECVLLSGEHSLILTCCWVSLKEIGIFLGSLVERILAEVKSSHCLLITEDLRRASKVFKDILLKCRHWGAIEGCCVGFTKFCASLLNSGDPELRDIPAHMLKQGLQVLQSPRSTSVTRRAAGLPMLILCVVSAEESSRARPLLAHSMQTLMETARSHLPQSWDQTLDLPQVCAVHTLQALVRGSGLGVAVLQFAADVAILSLTLLSSPNWAMRNAALQLYSSLCSRMLGQQPGGDEGSLKQHGMSPAAFFLHYPTLQPFLLDELRGAAQDFQGPAEEARLHLHPSLYPVLTLLAKLQPGVPDQTGALSDFRAPLLQLAASPIHSVRVMASRALVAMTPPSEYMNILLQLTAELPGPQKLCCHNRLHGRLLQIKALLDRALCTQRARSADLDEVVGRVEAALWLATSAQRCPLVAAAYIAVADALRGCCSEAFLRKLSSTLLQELHVPQHRLQVASLFYHQAAAQFLCADQSWACQLWENFSTTSTDLKLTLVTWVVRRRGSKGTSLQQVIRSVLQANLQEELVSRCVDYRRTYLEALTAVMTSGGCSALPQNTSQSGPPEALELQKCLEMLLEDLEVQKGGPELLSQALSAASVLLSHSLQDSVIQRWCSVLESHHLPEAPEVLRIACAEALCLAGAPLLSRVWMGQVACRDPTTRLINTCLYLLQDESQQVRMKAARFASTLHHTSRGQRSVYLMQANQALPFLLDLLVEKCWDCPGTLELLLGHLPQSDPRSLLRGAAGETGCSSLYEQDEANVFAEPSVMSACLLPYLLRMAGKYSESPALAACLRAWANKNVSQVLDSLAACKDLQPGETLDSAWLALLMDPRLHCTLCGLFSRAALLLRLLRASDLRQLCDPLTLHRNLQEAFALFRQNGVQFPSTFTATVAGEPPV